MEKKTGNTLQKFIKLVLHRNKLKGRRFYSACVLSEMEGRL
ncbi:hypothetical protein SAMN04488502_1252 [Dendrosporobacter quercicolus]|uniref:Uncharacterized protein n=1 Tax=Dendrosporobacter quercicolus TaxID=146817 RepID=A0A1H0AWH0_9FIRM|nr:hypothetical protein SAMN04488502_1252 [Dendrosporobacter quercicolus]